MSSSATSPTPLTGQWPPQRPSKRSKLRNGTFIVPGTGERARRHFTLRSLLPSSQTDGPAGDPEDPSSILHIFAAEQSMSDRAHAVTHNLRASGLRLVEWLGSPQGRGVLKCTLAYTLASLFTFWSPLSDFLGKPDGKHVVATITVYFHPARTAGSMIEAILVAIVAVAYAETVSILSMCTSVLVGGVWGMVRLAHALVLVVFIGGSFGFIGWMKQRLNNPLVNVGSTLASLAIIGVVTKETAVLTNVFSNQKLTQIFKMLICAIMTTTTVNLLLWRVSAVALLRQSMTKASTSLGDMLAMVTRGFLSGSEDDILSGEFATASAMYAAVYPQLTKNLREAKFERYFVGYEKLYQLDRAVVKSMETLAQSIGGLRSAANTQFALLKEAVEPASGTLSPGRSPISPTLQKSISSMLKGNRDRFLALSSIDEASEESTEDARDRIRERRLSSGPSTSLPAFRHPSEIFELFIALLGPSMKSLAYTLSEVLREPPFGSAPGYAITVNDHFRQSLTDALGLFNTARASALQELYRHLEFGRAKSEKIQADFEEVAAACGHFSFSLQAFGEEMQKYLDVLDDLKYASEHKVRSWHWMRWWRPLNHHSRKLPALPYDSSYFSATGHEETESLIKPIKKTAIPRGIPDVILERRDTYAWQQAPGSSKVVATLSQRLLRLLRKIARDDVRFGLKVGIGATLWAMFAFIPQTRDTYQHWRGEWGLLSFMIVCSMTVGAANTTGMARFMGTIIGAGASFVNWTVTQGNAIGLLFLGWLIAFWSFWMILARGKAPFGRITLLAYNVSTLYAYSLSQKVEDDDDDEGGTHPIIGEIVRHRFIAVTAGIMWGLIVCRLIWPISARRKFKEGLSMLYLQMGLIWKRGPLAILLRSDCSRSYLKSGEQTALLKYATRLDALRDSASSEFELRGPFPSEKTARIMKCTHRLLDAFHAMSLVTQRRGHLTEGERALLLFTADERALLCDRICHVFQVLASSLMLEYPLTDAVPSVVGPRDQLLGKIFQFRKEHAVVPPLLMDVGSSSGETTGGGNGNSTAVTAGGGLGTLAKVPAEEKDYALLYAYALVTGQVAEELRVVAKEIEELFGRLDVQSSLLLQ
ncbi:Fusaric acid resistance protein-like-domain-containing protein [Apodospora peruviana]|uniref:Fusaric acid resistance protein-like-domain-containing protein n=1 Tax=Apodospora peruviana TaxID=516989 RepID=A0AAE0IHB3_9PEZI|nr:Fusaric acid resistance protein-like-domain-containing protein [Apodospora peruviana]